MKKNTLSVLCLTDGPAQQVSAALKFLRPLADEIVIAVDSRLDKTEYALLEEIADVIVRFEFVPPIERSFPWAYSLCSGDWILRIDSDEVVSTALTDNLPELLARYDVVQYWLPMRWIYPDPIHWIQEAPWWPDFHPRLVRNDQTSLRFEGNIHTSLVRWSPYRLIDAPLYHLDCVITSLASRQAKARKYEDMAPGIMSFGRSVNSYYLPELFAFQPPVPIPETDRARISSVLDGREFDKKRRSFSQSTRRNRARKSSLEPRLALQAEIDRHSLNLAAESREYRAEIVPWQFENPMRSGQGSLIHVNVTNTSNFSWPDAPDDIRLTYQWWQDGAPIISEGWRTPLPSIVRPGETVLLEMAVDAPEKPGKYELVIDLVHEGVRWFDTPNRMLVSVHPLHWVQTLPGEPAEVDDSFGLFAIVGTWNEEDVIEATIQNAFAQGCEKVFIIDNDSDDDTVARALGVGAELLTVFHTDKFDEALRFKLLNENVEQVSVASGYAKLWWLWMDADEFAHGPAGQTLREYLETIDVQCRIVGAKYLNHYPSGTPQYVRSHHPLDFQPQAELLNWNNCENHHRKHPLQRWDDGASKIKAGFGFHKASSAVQLFEPENSIIIHHFPFRDEETTRNRMENLYLGGGGSGPRANNNFVNRHGLARLESLNAVYSQDWDKVRDFTREYSFDDEIGITVQHWSAFVDEEDLDIVRWY